MFACCIIVLSILDIQSSAAHEINEAVHQFFSTFFLLFINNLPMIVLRLLVNTHADDATAYRNIFKIQDFRTDL